MTWRCLWTLLLGLSSCTLLTQTERRQCRDNRDCSRRGLAGFVCSDHGACARLPCAADTDCAAAGKAFADLICEAEGCTPRACTADEDCAVGSESEFACSGGRCVPATCQQDEDCADFGGAAAYICQGARCQPPICRRDGDCQGVDERCDQGRCARTRCVNDQQCRAAGGPFASYICDLSACEPAACTTDALCRSLDKEFRCIDGRCEEPVWGCIGGRQPRIPVVDRITVRVRIEDTADYQVPKDLSVQVCGGMDQSCNAPVEAAISLDKDGRTVFELAISDRGFEGVFLIRGEGVLDVYYVEERPLVADVVLPPIRMFSPALVTLLVPLDQPGAVTHEGLIISQTLDCQGRNVAGVDVSLDPLGDAIRGSIDEGGAPDSKHPTTSSRGLAVIINVDVDPPRLVNLVGTIAATGQEVANFRVPVFPNSATYANIDPR